jgi:hypothetical protein
MLTGLCPVSNYTRLGKAQVDKEREREREGERKRREKNSVSLFPSPPSPPPFLSPIKDREVGIRNTANKHLMV